MIRPKNKRKRAEDKEKLNEGSCRILSQSMMQERITKMKIRKFLGYGVVELPRIKLGFTDPQQSAWCNTDFLACDVT